MLFLSDTRDHFTRMVLYLEFGGKIPRIEPEIFGNNPYIKKVKTKEIPLLSQTLILDKETGSWCICNKSEIALLNTLKGKRLNTIMLENSSYSPVELEEFIIQLYCRGLLLINNKSFYNPDVFKNGYISAGKALFLIIPTTKCNLSCRYCSASNPLSKTMKMKFEVAKKIIDLIMNFPSDQATILFHGGEPLLAFDLIESVVTYAHQCNSAFKKNLQFRLQTNGTLLSKKIVKKLASLNIALGISFDGGEEINDMTRLTSRGKSSFKAALKGLSNAHDENLNFGSICVLNRFNYSRIPEILAFYSQNGLYSIKINPISMLGKANQQWTDIGISANEYLQAHSSYLRYLKKTQIGTPKEENICHMINIISSRLSPYMCMRSQCGAGQDFFAFTPDGNIYPCDRYRQNKAFILGNVFSVSDLSGIKESHQLISGVFSRNIHGIEECHSCDYKLFCRGGCTLETYNYFADIKHAHPWCNYYKRMYRKLFLFISQRPDLVNYLCENVNVFKKSFFSS